jgi:drug/metabolite transporter (DMT)-like permease
MNSTSRGSIEMTLAMTLLGTIGWFVVQSGQPVMSVVFWRCAFGAPTLFMVCLALKLFKKISFRQVGMAALGGVAIVLNWLLLFGAYSHASISVATALYNTQPFMLIGFGALLFGEKPTPTKVGWLGIAFLGLLLIVQARPEASYVGSNFPLGIIMALGAAFFWGVAAVVTKKLTGTPPHLIALVQVCVGVVMLAPFVGWSSLPVNGKTWTILATVGVVHTGIIYILMYSAIQRLPTHLQGSLSFLYPVVAILVDVVGLKHHLQAIQMIGAMTILVAAAGMNLGESVWWFRKRIK